MCECLALQQRCRQACVWKHQCLARICLHWVGLRWGRQECAKPVIALACSNIGAELLKARAAGLLAMALHREGLRSGREMGLIRLELLRSSGDQAEIAVALYFLGALYQYWGKHERARSYLQQCIAVAQAAGMYQDMVLGLIGLGNVALDIGDLAQARQLYDEALTQCRQSEATGVARLANSLIGLGSETVRAVGDLVSARRYLWEVLREIRPTRAVTAKALAGAACVLWGEGRLSQAAEVCAFLMEWQATEYATRQKVGQALAELEADSHQNSSWPRLPAVGTGKLDEVVAELVGE